LKRTPFLFLIAAVVQVSTTCWWNCAMTRAQSQPSPILYGSVRLSTQQQEPKSSVKEPSISIPRPEIKKPVLKRKLPVTVNKPISQTTAVTATALYNSPPKCLPPRLWPGNYFDRKLATSLLRDRTKGHHIWRNIPDWRAGSWTCWQETNTRWQKYVNGTTAIEQKPLGIHPAAGAESIGLERDRYGTVWDEFGGGYWQEMDYAADKGHTYVTFRVPGDYSNTDYYAESVEFDVDKRTNKIKSVEQRRTKSRSTYIAPDRMKEEEMHTVYNEKGKLIESAWNAIELKRISSFAEVESERSDFVRYLTEKGLQNLIPVGSVSAQQASVQKKAAKATPTAASNHTPGRQSN
jgi:hypothetical protein